MKEEWEITLDWVGRCRACRTSQTIVKAAASTQRNGQPLEDFEQWEGGSCLGTHVRIKDFKIKKKIKIKIKIFFKKRKKNP